MAWDGKAGGFNYYRSTGAKAMWMLAGNSRDALRDSSRGKGPFESHPSGALLMKELKTPWINWHSPAANISEDAFADNDPRRSHEWFTKKEPGGGLTFEFEAARPAMAKIVKGKSSFSQEMVNSILAAAKAGSAGGGPESLREENYQ